MTGSRASSATVRSQITGGATAGPARALILVAVVGLTVGLAVVWTVVARRQLVASIVADSAEHLVQAEKAFGRLRARTQSHLQALCRVLSEDPRLKSTLATEGMDAATVADILDDIGKLRGSGFFVVLTPEGRVFVEAGAAGLRGLDLSESAVVKSAKGSTEAVVGSWVLDKSVMDLSVMVVRYDQSIVAYLVVGQSIDKALLTEVADETGVEVASALADTVVLASSSDAGMQAVLARVAAQAGGFKDRVLTVNGEPYVTSVVELSGSAQPHRLVLARALGRATPAFERLRWLILIPPFLVLISVLFAMSGTRGIRRT